MQAFLNRCAEIEEVLAQVYRELAAVYAADHALEAIWLNMADDESEHAREIHLAKRLLRDDLIVREQVPDAQIRKLLFRAHKILAKVRRSVLPVKEALRLSLHLEDEFRQVHVLCAVRFADSAVQKIFERLGRADREHVARLAEYCRLFAAREKAQGSESSPA